MSETSIFLVNQQESAIVCDLTSCVVSASFFEASAVDGFENQLREVVRRGFSSSEDSFVLGMLMMALTSATETYFRTIIGGAVVSCPFSHAHNVDKGKISFRAINYYPESMLVLALLEHVSFSDSEAIRKQVNELLQIAVPSADKGANSIATALQHFDQVCALRHALIHSAGLVNSQNCAEAGLSGIGIVAPSINGLQMVADICRNVVLSFNQFLFNSIIGRLYQRGLVVGDMQSDEKFIRPLTALFLSKSSPGYSSDFSVTHSAIHLAYGPKN